MTTERLHKIQLAERQLNTALELYFRDGDLASVITLAGAAEEILGMVLRINGAQNSLDELIDGTCEIHRIFFGEDISREVARNRANLAKNNFKHLNSEKDLEISIDIAEEAKDMLNRAVTNYWRVKGDLSEMMLRFESQQRGA